MFYEKCREILLGECEVIQSAAFTQEKLRIAVMNKEWMDFERYSGEMNAIEAKMTLFESERERLFEVFEALTRQNTYSGINDAKGRFYRMASFLPENQRNDLTAIYRSLKMETLKLRLANEALITYMAGIKSTLSEFFSLAFPERAGKLYTPRGTHFSHDMRSMVLNQSF
ncbi:MAG: hypothetical protein FWC03_10370 [Treponema sp.]|nr:hypothetical protein [Treponema sp.]